MLTDKTEFDQINDRLTALEIDVAVIKSNYGTKEDIAKLETKIAGVEIQIAGIGTQIAGVETKIAQVKNEITVMAITLIKWSIGTAIALTSATFAIARFVH